MPIKIIVCLDKAGGFSKDGTMPWHFPEDFRRFKEITNNSICVMGRKTYEDMLQMVKSRKKDKDAPIEAILPGRTSYVLSSNVDLVCEGATRVSELQKVLDDHQNDTIFVLGGESLFIQALSHAKTVHCTVIDKSFNCDKFFPVHILHQGYKIAAGDKYTNEDGTILYFLEYTKNEVS